MEYFKLFYTFWCVVMSQVKCLISQIIRPVNIPEKYHLKGKTFSSYKAFNLSGGVFLHNAWSKYYLDLKFNWLNRE